MKPRALPLEVYSDSLLAEVSDSVRLFHVGLILVAGAAGVAPDDPAELARRLFPVQPPRPIAEMIDLLGVLGFLRRAVAPDGERVLVLRRVAEGRPAPRKGAGSGGSLGPPETFMALPVPSLVQRNAVQARLGVSRDGTPVGVVCERCGMNGVLRFVAPEIGLEDTWGGAVVAGAVEIVPDGDEFHLLCRGCRTDTAYVAPPQTEPASVVNLDGARARQVFEAWRTSTGRSASTVLDAARRRLIERALRDYPLEDVLDAVRGWEHIAHNRGENDAGRPYNDLELLLRDAQHIERFRDAARGPRGEVNRGRRAAANVGQFGKTGVGEWA